MCKPHVTTSARWNSCKSLVLHVQVWCGCRVLHYGPIQPISERHSRRLVTCASQPASGNAIITHITSYTTSYIIISIPLQSAHFYLSNRLQECMAFMSASFVPTCSACDRNSAIVTVRSWLCLEHCSTAVQRRTIPVRDSLFWFGRFPRPAPCGAAHFLWTKFYCEHDDEWCLHVLLCWHEWIVDVQLGG